MRSQENIAIVIMAAGKGTRMKSDLAKVLHPLNGRAMIHYVIQTARELGGDPIVVIVGHQKEEVQKELKNYLVAFAVQEPQLGTGHAVMCALPLIPAKRGLVLILSGDVPLIRRETLKRLLDCHVQSAACATVMTARTDGPTGYGRIVRQSSGSLSAIVEERDANDNIKDINEINSGIYVFELMELRKVLPRITDENDQKEFYLTDAVRLLASGGRTVAACEGDFREVMGINTVKELIEAEKLLLGWELQKGGSV